MNPQPPPESSQDTAIIHQSSALDAYQDTEYLEASLADIESPAVNPLLTPWSVGAIVILLVANSLLSWNQLKKEQKQVNNATQVVVEHPLRVPAALNLAAGGRILAPDTVSIMPAPPPPPVLAVKVPPAPSPQMKAVSAAPAPGTLTRALLPQFVIAPQVSQSPQQQLMPTYPAPATTPVAPKVKAPTSSPKIARKPEPEVSPQPSPSPAVINERLMEEWRERTEVPLQPLYQRRKQQLLELKAPQNNQPVPPQAEPPQPPEKIPSSIIIDRSGVVAK